ncbi:MAG: hypothetical protein RLZZ227_1904, partial [Pseudomonadota bacterium]
MLVVVLRADGSAALADIGAELAQLRGKLAAARHYLGGQAAQRRTVEIDADAVDHVCNMAFVEARSRTVITGGGAGVTGFDAVEVSGMWHDAS